MIRSELQFDLLLFHCINLNIESFVRFMVIMQKKKNCTKCLCFSFLANPLPINRIFYAGKLMFHFVGKLNHLHG